MFLYNDVCDNCGYEEVYGVLVSPLVVVQAVYLLQKYWAFSMAEIFILKLHLLRAIVYGHL